MKKKICVFTGAGISAPLDLPLTHEFEKTIEGIPGALLAQIKSFLTENEASDIEKVLYLLEDFSKEADFTHHIVKQGISTPHFQTVNQNILTYKAQAKQALEAIKADIYLLLEKYDAKKAHQLYSSLIKEIKAEFENASLSFFTTNYDLTFENGFADNEDDLKKVGITEVLYGFSGRNGRAQYNTSEVFEWRPEIIEYKKLHGSLDWNKDRSGVCLRTGAALDPKHPEKMPMLYPGIKGTPTDQPFIDLHEKLDLRLNQANIVFVLGFAFRDDYINNIFEYALRRNKNLMILCYNPLKTGKYPKDSRLDYFAKNFPNNFHHIELPIEVSDTPLNLNEVLKLEQIKIILEASEFKSEA